MEGTLSRCGTLVGGGAWTQRPESAVRLAPTFGTRLGLRPTAPVGVDQAALAMAAHCGSIRVDETYIKIRGQWRYLYRAIDKHGNPVDFLLTAKRALEAAKRFFRKM